MQRYTVTIVSSGDSKERPVLLVPFQPSALVTAFVDELFKRIARQGLAIAPNTHIATLHLDSETGGLVDVEDLLSDVVLDPKNDKLFAVFSQKNAGTSAATQGQSTISSSAQGSLQQSSGLALRVVTATNSKDPRTCPIVHLPHSATIRQLHDAVADQLHIPRKYDEAADMLECNCQLAKRLADGSADGSSFFVVHGKSIVERLSLGNATDTSLRAALRHRFGVDFENTKRVELTGAEYVPHLPTIYKKNPVAAICSKKRHTPVHARSDFEDKDERRSSILDLHTFELPIHPGCMDVPLEAAGMTELSVDGVVDIYCVKRRTTKMNAVNVGKSNIYRSRAPWEPPVVQSDRGMAIFLSSLRVFASLVQDMRHEQHSQDAVLHAFDLLTQFPPALRTLSILIAGKTPTAAESAALSQAIYEVLDSFMSNFTDITGTDHTRVFEGARLFFGFVLEKARVLKLPAEDDATYPYLASLQTKELRDHRTNEGVMDALQTSTGLTEAALFGYFLEGGLLAGSHLQTYMVQAPTDAALARVALLSAGVSQEIVVFSKTQLQSDYRYPDAGDLIAAMDVSELTELNHLAELCGRNKLAVHKPSLLASAVAPCLTFDRNAHLAVYTGEQPCGDPGRSSILFRPKHGDESIDAAVVEQLIAPLLTGYEADGTAVFDALGGAAVRRLQAPDEILMFCVDTSASMRSKTDFAEIDDADDDDDGPSDEAKVERLVESELYGSVTFDNMKVGLCANEGFDDMIAIIANADFASRRHVTKEVVKILRTLLSTDILKKSERIENRRQHGRGWYHVRREIEEGKAELKTLKSFWAGLKTHEDAVEVFLMFRATTTSHDISQRWQWSLGDRPPASAPRQHIPSLDAALTAMPHRLTCPISRALMNDAVTAADGHAYSQAAISRWFNIRKSSPMTGLELQDTTLTSNQGICDAAQRWMMGEDIASRDSGAMSPFKRLKPKQLEITFDSKDGSFSRILSPSTNLQDLYKIAFRGLKGRFMVFQLATDRYGPLSPSPEATISSRNIRNGDHIAIRIADDDPSSSRGTSSASVNSDRVLIKVYEDGQHLEFGYWVQKDSTATMASIIWKYWRYRLRQSAYVYVSEKQIWTSMLDSGDNLLTGQPQDATERVSRFFNRTYCSGHLGDERVYREPNAPVQGEADPLVFKVKVNRPHRPKHDRNYLTRLDVLKQMFEALINRTLAYNYKTHVGLVTFATTPNMTTDISHVIENFRRAIDDMHATGDTALWDALALAKDQLVEYNKKYPQAKKRIICISDGVDTKSITNKAPEICWRLHEVGIVLDSVSLGDESNRDLKAISYLLGSYCFHPTTLANALAICELEPFLSLTERPPVTPPRNTPRDRTSYQSHFWNAKHKARYTIANEGKFPPRKVHPNMDDGFVQLTAIAARPINNNTANSRSNLRISRLMNEIRAIATSGAHPKYDVYVSETDMSFWKIAMSGPDDSPYSAGTFLLYLHADENYPTFAPKARFVTRIKHPNINVHGRVCHSILDRDWTTDTTMATLLDSIYGILLQPEFSDPVNTTTTLGFHHDQVEFAEEVREHVDLYASRSREWWRKEVLGEGHDGDDEDEYELAGLDSGERYDDDDEEDGWYGRVPGSY